MSSMDTNKIDSKDLLIQDTVEAICRITKCTATIPNEEAEKYIRNTLNMIWGIAFTKGVESEKIKNNNVKMTDFNIDAAEQGETVRTRGGLPVRILCYDAKGDKPIVAIIENENEDKVVRYTVTGKVDNFSDGTPRQDDLVIVRAKHEGWMLMDQGQALFTSEEVAIKNKRSDLIIAHVEW